MKDYGRSFQGSQVASAANALKKTTGLQFQEIFSGEQVSTAIASTISPESRNRAFPP